MKRVIARYVALYRLLWITKEIKGEYSKLKTSQVGEQQFVLLPDTPDSRVPGPQSLFWESRSGHALVEPATLTDSGRLFRVIKLFRGDLLNIRGAWLSGWLGEKPEDFGIEEYDRIRMPNGTLAIQKRASGSRWVIHVHGRKTLIGETLRNFPLLDELGYNQLSISHESDPKPYGLGKHRSKFGFDEWKEVEAAVQYSVDEGASEIVLVGFSLGAMMVGQFLRNSSYGNRVNAVIFDSPMFDVRNTLRLQASISGFDAGFADEICNLMKESRILRLLGYPKLDVDSFSLAKNAILSPIPMLVLYSTNDGYVAHLDSEVFVKLNPTTTLVNFPQARHCRLFNSDQPKYELAIRNFLETSKT